MCRLSTYNCLEGAVLAHHPRYEPALAVGIYKFDWIDSAKCRRDFGRRHLAEENEQLSVTQWLPRERMLGSGLDQMRDIPIGEPY